jgi:hypothetical protein
MAKKDEKIITHISNFENEKEFLMSLKYFIKFNKLLLS